MTGGLTLGGSLGFSATGGGCLCPVKPLGGSTGGTEIDDVIDEVIEDDISDEVSDDVIEADIRGEKGGSLLEPSLALPPLFFPANDPRSGLVIKVDPPCSASKKCPDIFLGMELAFFSVP